jgi:REP element-mobilizing transposase RayT
MVETLRFTRRNLPHWIVADRTYFVTIRLVGSLPKQVIVDMRAELAALRESIHSDTAIYEAQRRQFVKLEQILDTCDSSRAWLIRPDVAENLVANLDWLEQAEQGWDIYAAVVMSNHMHLLMRNRAGKTANLQKDLACYKCYTARQANRVLDRSGAFWAREDFDHWCRTPEKVKGAVAYIQQNPVKAGLCRQWQDWSWTRVKDGW